MSAISFTWIRIFLFGINNWGNTCYCMFLHIFFFSNYFCNIDFYSLKKLALKWILFKALATDEITLLQVIKNLFCIDLLHWCNIYISRKVLHIFWIFKKNHKKNWKVIWNKISTTRQDNSWSLFSEKSTTWHNFHQKFRNANYWNIIKGRRFKTFAW